MVRTAGVAVAAEVEVAFAEDVFGVELLDGQGGRGVEHVVVVPGDGVGVHEDGDVGEGVVARDDVGEVGHHLVAFVEGDGVGGVVVVDGVDEGFEEGVWGEGEGRPGGVFRTGAGDDEGACAVERSWGWWGGGVVDVEDGW